MNYSEYRQQENVENVCDSQRRFNLAFKEAVDYYDEKKKYDEEEFKARHPMTTMLMVVFYLILVVWALILAAKVGTKEQRVLHISLALLFPPTYIVGYYIDQLSTAQASTTPQ
jgi:hypothetical protein